MLTLLFLLQAAADDIVITGKRLVEAHAACVKGGCSPLRDAQATIALAESQFRDGSYLKAKGLLAAAIARNKDKETTDPKPVAALYEAYATVSLHEGDQREYRRAVARQVRTLRDNLPEGDSSVLAASTALGDMWLKLGHFHRADIAYESVEKDALASGQEVAAMLVGMKRVWLASTMDSLPTALSRLKHLEARPLAQQQGFATALRVLRLRIAARSADDQEMAQLVSQVAQRQGEDPVLIWAPRYEPDSAGAATEARALATRLGDANPLPDRSSDFAGIQWADIGFWIRPDGHTAEAEVLRASRSNPWAASVLKQIEGRRYSARPGVVDVIDQGVYKIQRFTLRSTYSVPKGSLISRRVALGGYEILDLTGGGSGAASTESCAVSACEPLRSRPVRLDTHRASSSVP